MARKSYELSLVNQRQHRFVRELELSFSPELLIAKPMQEDISTEMEIKNEDIVSDMYKFIDQAYSWALEGMKFVTSLNMENCLTAETCQSVLAKFDEYMESHPPIPESDFVEVHQSASLLGDTKVLRQCEFAKEKCQETSTLFNKRRDLIEKIKTQILGSSKKVTASSKMKEKLEAGRSLSTTRPGSCSNCESSDLDETRTASVISDMSSLDTISICSAESSGFDELSQHTIQSTSSSNYTELSEASNCASSIPKPTQSFLKKSASMPNRLMAQQISHLHSHSGVTLTIGPPVPVLEEADTTGKSKLALVIEELISTERNYVKSLNYVIEHYFPEMKKLDIPQTLRCKGNVIFGNIEKIAEFHSGYFLRDLEKCQGNPLLVAKTFQAHKENFGLYALYSKNKPLSDQLLQEYGNEFFKAKQLELGDKMDLASYLLKPVQRMGKYALLLHAMSKRAASSDKRSLTEAEELVKFQLRHGNDLLTMDSIQGCDVNLKEQGNLLRQEQFTIFYGRRKIVRRVFLFEDLILFSKPFHVHGGHDIYQYKTSYKTVEIGMTETIGDSGFKFEIWFRKRKPQPSQDRYVLQSNTQAIKSAWVDEIRGLLWRQALKSKDHRKHEMSSMGVGSKPHLDLVLSSENAITDRAVGSNNPTFEHSFLAEYGEKSQSSAEEINFDANQQLKRSHSAISTTSSSSAGSGRNPNGGFITSFSNMISWSSKSDSMSRPTQVPPMAYSHFHAIPESITEDCGSANESSSSLCTSFDVPSEVSGKTPLTRQYISTPNIGLLVD